MDSTTRRKRERGYQKRANVKQLANGGGVGDDDDVDKRSLLLGSLLALLVAPITFRLTKIIEMDPFKADILASILTLIFTVIFSILINNIYYKHYGSINTKRRYYNNNLKNNKNKTSRSVNDTSYSWRLINGVCYYIYGQPSAQKPTSSASRFRAFRGGRNNFNTSFNSQFSDDYDLNDSQHQQHQPRQFQSKIDPKYFKPKFIMHELMTFWDTTCTVVTWGSFYVIGGTICATEKLAQKMKTKRSSQRDSNNLRDGTASGRFDSFTSSFTSSSPTSPKATTNNRRQETTTASRRENAADQQQQQQHTANKISAWTKRSYSSVKKKITRITTLNGTNGVGHMPQIEESRGLLNTSFLSASFRS